MIPRNMFRNLRSLLHQRILSAGYPRNLTTSTPKFAKTSSPQDEELNNTPVKYFGSGAATWRAKDTHSGGADEALWYQPYVISASLAIFLIYFCILREENDIDRKLEGSLFEHIEGLEEQQLVVSYKYNRDNGLATKDIENRLLELGIDARKLDQ